MSQVQNGDTVRVHYTGKLEDGTVFDSSKGREPLEFTIGQEQVIPGFEQAVVGMTPGESKSERIEMEQAYGPRNEALVVNVGRQDFPDDMTPQVGDRVNLRRDDGRLIPVLITEVTDTEVTLDANHPLAGQNLVFDIELVDIG